jgi:hypothetical protein
VFTNLYFTNMFMTLCKMLYTTKVLTACYTRYDRLCGGVLASFSSHFLS